MKYKVKAAVLPDFRSRFMIKEVELEAPDDWVLVDVKYVGICGRDVVVWKGGFKNLKPPLILGHEVFGYYKGTPVAVFPGVKSKECERTDLCEAFSVLGEQVPGGYANRVAVPEWNIIALKDHDLVKYAASACGVATFVHVAKILGIKEGDRVLVTGASGGVGIHGIQHLKLLGAEVYAFTRDKSKAKIIEKLGVNVVTDFDFYRSVGRMDHVIELVGARTLNESMRSLRFKGSIALVGNVTGEPIFIERPALFIMRELKMTGSAAYSKEEYIEALNEIEKGYIRPFYKLYNFYDINDAYEDVLSSMIIGRAILSI